MGLTLATDPSSVWLAISVGIVAGLTTGIAVGVVNGIGIGIFNVTPFMMTLSMILIAFGLATHLERRFACLWHVSGTRDDLRLQQV